MDRRVMDYLMDKMDSRRDGRGGRDSRDSRDSRGGGDSRGYGDSRDSRKSDFSDMRGGQDSRQGGGRGVVDFEGSMDFNESKHSERWGSDERYDSRDYRDSRDMRDSRDYHDAPKLSKSDILRWKQKMENEDGTRGAHFDMQQIMNVAEKLNVKFDEFDEREFCIAVNMMYSDYCKVARKYVAPDKELMFFAELAKAFLDDEDAPEASEKLALYYHCIVDA